VNTIRKDMVLTILVITVKKKSTQNVFQNQQVNLSYLLNIGTQH